MKREVIFLLCMMITIFAFGQEEKQGLQVNVDVDEVKVTPPTFTGIENSVTMRQGEKTASIEDYLMKNINYPEEAVRQFARGTEVVQFIVTPAGQVTDFNVINSVSPQIDEEIIRVLKTTNGMWIPGHNNENHVAMEKEVSIVFKISGFKSKDEDFNAMAQEYSTQGSTLLLMKDNPKKALKAFDKGILLRPNDKCLLLTRGLARYEVGDKEGAKRDWTRLKELGNDLGDYYVKNFDGLKGYAELTRILDE
jgi:TonB family protein